MILLKRRVSPIPNPIIDAETTRNNALRSILEGLVRSPVNRAMGTMIMAEERVLIAFNRMGSTFLRAFAERTVETAHRIAVRTARVSPSIVSKPR